MNDAQFLNLISHIQPTIYEDIGLAVGFGNIYKALFANLQNYQVKQNR